MKPTKVPYAGDNTILFANSHALHYVLLIFVACCSPADGFGVRCFTKPRLHQIHVAGYKYPGRATCIRIQVDTYRSNFVPDTGYM